MKIHNTLGPGFLESVYHRAMEHELAQHHIQFSSEKPLEVWYDEINIGHFYADLFVEEVLIIEFKSVRSITKEHEVQLVNYLNASKVENGLLLNFGGESLQFKRKFRAYRSR